MLKLDELRAAPCPHDISEQDVAAQVDGLCPLCLQGKVEVLRAAQEWQPIETAPADVDVLLCWWDEWPQGQWKQDLNLAICTKGGWRHGRATHWMSLPEPPNDAR